MENNEILSVVNLSKKYKENKILKDISFNLKEGETLCIIGPSGSGKSTLLRCINNLEKINGGKITIDGLDLVKGYKADSTIYSDKKTLAKINMNTAFVFQDFNLFPHLTVGENITLSLTKVMKKSKKAANDIALNMLKKMGLEDKMDEYPCNLSGGQKQRVGIARALAINPKILCMDEPTSALDPELVGEVLKVIKELSNENKTMIIVTHEIAFAREVSDRIIFINDGVIVEEGTPKEVIDNPKNQRTREFLKRYNLNIGEKSMTKQINQIEPKEVIKYFKEISDIPRNSSKEEKIRDYLVEFAKQRNLKYYTDDVYNVIITKESDKKYEQYDTLAFQAHTDMVCEKTPSSEHDFGKDSIKLIIDGDYIKADSTTLGADNGIGVALILALLDSNIKTPKLECIFTTQEETTMIGVKQLNMDKITSRRIISLDGGKEGKMVISSANCLEWYSKIEIEKEELDKEKYLVYELEYSNFKGGHSGGAIADKTRGNPIKLGIEILKKIDDIRIIDICSSGKVNVIPRDFKILFALNKKNANIEEIEKIIDLQKNEFKEASISLNRIKQNKKIIAITKEITTKLITFISSFRNGALEYDNNNNYILSANMGAVNIIDGYIKLEYSLRANDIELRNKYLESLNTLVNDNSVKIIWQQELFGFEPNYDSSLINKISEKYKELTNENMESIITQGVLEGGFFLNKMSDVEYIAIGPNTYDVHSPKERVSISSIERIWKLIQEIVKIKF